MWSLEHRVRVFVFQVLDRRIEYLLLRHKPREEWPLGPVVGPVTPGEKLEDAIRREVHADEQVAAIEAIREHTRHRAHRGHG